MFINYSIVLKYLLIYILYTSSISLFANSEDLVHKINQYRESYGLGALVKEDLLFKTAEKYNNLQAQSLQMSHIDDKGNRALERYKIEKGTASKIGEILGTGRSLDDILMSWKKSPKHNQVMLNPKWYRISCSIRDMDGTYIVTILFSNSTVNSWEYFNESQLLALQIIDRMDVNDIFIPILNTTDHYYQSQNNNNTIDIYINRNKLPLVLTIYYRSTSKKEMSDIIYISGNLLGNRY